MPMIIRNNIRYAGGSGGSNGSGENIVELTQAEYDALGDVVNSDNITYYITDSDEQLDASSVVFDDTETQLGASDVQGAIEKVATDISELNKNFVNSKKLLWTNSNPTSEFPSVVVWYGDVTEYDYFEIDCKNKIGETIIVSQKIIPGFITTVFYPGNFDDGYMLHMWGREFWTDSRGVCCGQGRDQAFDENTASTANNIIIPINLYGVKLPK